MSEQSGQDSDSTVRELRKMPSRVLVRPPPMKRIPNLAPQIQEVDSDSESEEESGHGLGLGLDRLVFYGPNGSRRSKLYTPKKKEAVVETKKDEDEDEDEGVEAAAKSAPKSTTNTATAKLLPSPIRPSPLYVRRTRTHTMATTTSTAAKRSSSPSPPYDPDFGLPFDNLVDKLLEQNYRGQAETLFARSRNCSRATVPSPSVGSARSCSSGSAAVTPSATTETPGRQRVQSSAALRRSQSLRSPSIHNHKLSRSFSSTSRRTSFGFKPYRDQRKYSSGFASTIAPPRSPSTFGHHLLTPPQNASPRQFKSLSRSVSAARRSPLYFTHAERQAIAELVQAKPRDCQHAHTNCTDCTDLEYAYYENKIMATSLPPEERQRIINNNRSLRNIKNVRFNSSACFHTNIDLGT
jgi:hypothetical protein